MVRSSKPPDRVAAFRRNSREIVDGERPRCAAISGTPQPRARRMAISSRSTNDRYRPKRERRLKGGMPPNWQNQRVPKASDTPAATVTAHSIGQGRCIPSTAVDVPGGRTWAGQVTTSAGALLGLSADAFGFPSQHLHGVFRRPVESGQYLSIRYTERPAEAGIEPSVGSVSDSYDNALAESVTGLFKTEAVRRREPWRNVKDVEFATLEWVWWFNSHRPLGPIGHVPPAVY